MLRQVNGGQHDYVVFVVELINDKAALTGPQLFQLPEKWWVAAQGREMMKQIKWCLLYMACSLHTIRSAGGRVYFIVP